MAETEDVDFTEVEKQHDESSISDDEDESFGSQDPHVEEDPGVESDDEENCDYKFLEQLPDDDTEIETHSHIVDKSHSIRTTEYMTKYERASVLGLRSQQIKSGAPPMIKLDEEINGEKVFKDGKYPTETFKIAELELMYGRCPIILGRRLPNGEKIVVAVSKLKLI